MMDLENYASKPLNKILWCYSLVLSNFLTKFLHDGVKTVNIPS